MEPVRQHTFTIKLKGLIHLLAQTLYADPDVFLREMIQNAHDAITKRAELAEERGETKPPGARIDIRLDVTGQSIAIHDNGSGMTREEIADFLSTIGGSGTAELRTRLRDADRGRVVELIGQFGIGLLSAFIVAERVTVLTRAANGEGLQWECDGGETYSVRPAEREHIGSTVTLHLREGHSRYLDRDELRSIIRTYANFIGMPVYLDGEAEPANAVDGPWHRGYPSGKKRDEAYRLFWNREYDDGASVHVIAVDEPIEWETGPDPDDRARGRVQGVLAITDRYIPGAHGTADVYINRMFVNADNRDVLPTWARFLQGVIECGELTPNAARDNVIRNAALAAVQEALGRLILRELTELSQQDHQRFTEIMRLHAHHVLAMAVEDEHEQFFRTVADLVPLGSDQGPLSIADYLAAAPARTDGPRLIHYIAEHGSADQFFMLANARGIPVFNCAEPFAGEFLKRYVRTWPRKARLSRLDVADSATIFEPLTGDEAERFGHLETACNRVFPDRSCIAKASRFMPAKVPAVLTESHADRSRRELEQLAAEPTLTDDFRGIVDGFLADPRAPLTLHLNALNPTIQKLAARPDLRDEISVQAMDALYRNARMLLAGSSAADDVRVTFEHHTQVIETMLSLAEDQTETKRALSNSRAEVAKLRSEKSDDPGTELDPYVSCFVAMPFSDDRATAIYEAVRAVLEDAPYYWRVVRADDDVERAGLWDNLKVKLLRAHCFVTILTETVNPNVMIEIGRMEALQRPLLILRDAAAHELPADLDGRLFETLRDEGRDLVEEVRRVLRRQHTLPKEGGARYLSEAVMRNAEIYEEAGKTIRDQYSTWDQFLAVDPMIVAQKLGVQEYHITLLHKWLRDH